MATATPSNTQTSTGTLKAFEEKIKTQVADAKSKLDQFEAKEKKAEAEAATISHLKTAKQNIDRKLQDLKATHDAHIAHAKSDIEADVAKFKASVDALGAKFKTIKK